MSDKDRSTAAAELVDAMRRDAPRRARQGSRAAAPRGRTAKTPESHPETRVRIPSGAGPGITPTRELRIEDEALPWGTVHLELDDGALMEVRREHHARIEAERRRAEREAKRAQLERENAAPDLFEDVERRESA